MKILFQFFSFAPKFGIIENLILIYGGIVPYGSGKDCKSFVLNDRDSSILSAANFLEI